MDQPDFDTSVVVVGAGQAGLSVAYYLRRLGLDPGNDFVLLDRGPGTGGAWQYRWEALRIGYAHRINDLPGMDELGLSFETADRQAPAKQVVADYYARYEEHFGFQVVRPADVTLVTPELDGVKVDFEIDLPDEQTGSPDDRPAPRGLFGRRRDPEPEPEPDPAAATRTLRAPVLVNATGTWGAPFIPYYPGMNDFRGRHVHTVEYENAEAFRGQRVVVVGGGTSAIGFLLELEEVAAELTWVSRRPIEFLDGQEYDIEGSAQAVALQDEAAREGRVLPSVVSTTGVPRSRRIQAAIDRGLLVARPVFQSIVPHGVRWSNGFVLPADAIIWATGFRPELRHLAPLKLREKAGGVIVGGGASWRNPRVFFAGYGPTASTSGANKVGRTIARQVVATLSAMGR
ncbi:MAG: NAD(P)/FAD-dependent oxidoreductase [Actinomycetales bacterium]|nr:NAD(P)/FAD-dependent oxidoreductase [Actinomycetales bacterium]